MACLWPVDAIFGRQSSGRRRQLGDTFWSTGWPMFEQWYLVGAHTVHVANVKCAVSNNLPKDMAKAPCLNSSFSCIVHVCMWYVYGLLVPVNFLEGIIANRSHVCRPTDATKLSSVLPVGLSPRWPHAQSWTVLWPCVHFHAEVTPRLCYRRSSSIVRSHVRLGRDLLAMWQTTCECLSFWRFLSLCMRTFDHISTSGLKSESYFKFGIPVFRKYTKTAKN